MWRDKVNKNLIDGCCSFQSFTLTQSFEGKIWAMKFTTEIGEKYSIKIYDTDQFNEDSEVFEFYPIQHKDLKQLCESPIKKALQYYHEHETLTFVVKDSQFGSLGLVAIFRECKFIISKDWFSY